jgi:DNA polymerase-3 subunit gamma/tau
MSHEWFKKYRPTKLEHLVGQAGAVKVLDGFLRAKKVPHAILLHGPSGCGKTTVARILKEAVGADDHNFMELNAADFKGIDTVREIRNTYKLGVMGGGNRLFLFDEAHKLTNDAQNALLKMLEDPPASAYFVLATTEPNKLIKTVRSRCTHIELCRLTDGDVRGLLVAVARRAKMDPPPHKELLDEIVKGVDGSARQALVSLEVAAAAGPELKDRLAAVAQPELERKSIELCRALMDDRKPWKEVQAILKGVQQEDPEQVRHGVIGYAKSALLNGWGKPNLAAVLMAYNVVKNRK